MPVLDSYVPRYYQRHARDNALFGWMEYNRQLLHLGTGAGKTAIAADIIGRTSPMERCLFLGDQNELVEQPRRAIRRITGMIAALEQGSSRASLEASVVVGSSQTFAIKKRRERFPRNHFSKIIVDESHRAIARDMEICDYYETAQVLGMTATPFTSKLRDLSNYYESTCYSMPLIDQTGEGLDLIGEGFAPPLLWTTLPEEFDLSGVRTTHGIDGEEFDQQQVDDIISPKFKTIAEFLGDTAQGKHIVVALGLISSSQKFADICRSMGLRARHVDGKSPDRDMILEGFNQGHFEILCNSNVLSTGVDLPIADYFLSLKAMRSANLYQQFLGRVMRVLPGLIDHLPEKHQAEIRRQIIRASAKPLATVCDPLFLHDELGAMHAGKLFAKNEEDAAELMKQVRKLRSPEEAAAIARMFQEKKEKDLKERLEKAAMRARARSIDAEHVGALLDSRELLNYEPTQKWEMDKPSERQLELLTNLGVDPETLKTKGQASRILDTLSKRFKLGLATLKQVKILRSYDQPDAATLEFAAASARMDWLFTQRKLERELVHG